MHNFLALIVTSMLATTAVAQDVVPTLDLNKVCKSGCIIEIAFDDSARIGPGTNVSGMFKTPTAANVMTFFAGMKVTGNGLTIYRLTSEPGTPMFDSLEGVKAYMDGVDSLIARERKRPAS